MLITALPVFIAAAGAYGWLVTPAGAGVDTGAVGVADGVPAVGEVLGVGLAPVVGDEDLGAGAGGGCGIGGNPYASAKLTVLLRNFLKSIRLKPISRIKSSTPFL